MVNLTKSLLDAISIIADKTIDEVSSDKTIKAVIKKSISTSEGKYLVTYNDGDFYAYTQSGATDVYQVDEQIYILVPEGDMSQKKFIIGRVKDENEDVSSLKTPTSSLLNDYVTLGTNAIVDKEYGSLVINRMQPLQLELQESGSFYYCYVKDKTEINQLEIDYDSITYPIVSIDEESFTNSAKQAEALLIRAKFKTDISTESIGHYGIIVNIAFEDKTNPQIDEEGNTVYPPKVIAYMLDTNKMTGNPMKFYDYTSQYMIAAFDGENYLYIDSIVAFSDGFDNTIEDSIYIDDIEIIALNEVSAINGDYKMKLTTPQGNTIKAGKKNNLKILANVTYLNKDVTKNTTFYWGVKDPLITSSDKDYHAKLGTGYRYLNVTNTNELLLTPANLTAAENMFVCIGVYESDIILKTSVLLYNNNNDLKITIESDQGTEFQFNEGNPTLTCLINGKTNNYQEDFPDSTFSFIWSREDNENGSALLDKTQAQLEREKEIELNECAINQETHRSNAGRTPVQVLSYYSTQISQVKNISYPNGVHGSKLSCTLKNINNYVTYSCSVYRGGIYVGYSSITLQNSKNVINTNYYVTITNGTQVFQYDESGIAPNSAKQQNPIEVLDLVAVFHNPQGIEVTPKKVRWIVPTNNTLINVPSLGLETNFETNEKYFSGNVYPLSIKENYDNNCNNNQVIAIVTHEDGTEYRQSSNLLFTKIGEIGTNGTDTVVKINELLNVPNDECLTIIKDNSGIVYNTGDSINTAVLEADLYTNNNKILGHSTKWTIAGSSSIQSQNYQVQTTNENTCIIDYVNNNDKLDTRIIKAQTNLNGKYFSSFYGIPAIEYYEGYNYTNYPIKIMQDGTLKTVLYDSNGMNPSYNDSQGVHVKLGDWINTGYLRWTVESGPKRNNSYNNVNLLLSKVPKSKTGSKDLSFSGDTEDIQSFILNIQDTGKICAENADSNIKKYIKEFLVDIEKICLDNILSVSSKIDLFWNRLNTFSDQALDKKNIYIKRVYEEYKILFEQIINEYQDCQNINKEYAEIYNKVQNIWKSEWPSVITEDRLFIKSNVNINSLKQLSDIYQNAYDNRSNNSSNIEIPNREDTFEQIFLDLLNNSKYGLDKYYEDYFIALGSSAISGHSILIEYTKILMAYINLIVNETQNYLKNNNEIKNKYSFAYSDWTSTNNSGDINTLNQHTIGKNIYDIIISADNTIANIYDNIRKLYKYYQTLYLNVTKYQITEESQTLNIWNAMLNGKDPDLLEQIYVIPNNIFNGLYMNNNVVGIAFIKENEIEIPIAKIYIPIIMTLNTYELASLNGWDGTNIDIGEDHIMTPQIGAGIKDDATNTFTGMVMGVVGSIEDENSFNHKKINKTGLIGYLDGKQSVFIDAETGKASFGLPEDDFSNEEGTSEGRIELVPGGVSKIGNWKIGNRFLYNIINGSYERRLDKDARNNNSEYKLMVPHDKHGIILSSDQPYIHVKGEVYEDENLTGINYDDEYNNINPGDSLELRIDPGNNSLFSIVQHTSGFGDEDMNDLMFGYKESGSDTMPIIKDYKANQNTDEDIQSGYGAEYYIYRLITDANGSFQPFYQQENISGFNINSSSVSNINISSGTIYLKNALINENFKKTAGSSPVFVVNSNSGLITYNPENLIWDNDSSINSGNSITGIENNDGWQTTTSKVSTTDSFSVNFQYNKIIENSPIEADTQIGSFSWNSDYNYKIYKIKVNNCYLQYQLTGINYNNLSNAYVQFYVVSNNNYNINKALLTSEIMNIRNNLNNIDINLSSLNKQYLIRNTQYYLKAHLYINSYIINNNCSCIVSNNILSSYQAPLDPNYGMKEVVTVSNSLYNTYTQDGINNQSVWFSYKLFQENSTYKIQLNVSSSRLIDYDVIVWRKGSSNTSSTVIGVGRSLAGNTQIRFCTSSAQTWNNLNIYATYNIAPTETNPWCISFYPIGTYTENIQEYSTDIEYESSNNNTDVENYNVLSTDITTGEILISTESGNVEDDVTQVSEEDLETINKYFKKSNSILVETKNQYNQIPNWGVWNTKNNYENNAKISWTIKLLNSSFGTITGFIPKNVNTLCVETDENNKITSLQGIPYAKTYWDQNNNLRVRLFKEYYDWINTSSTEKTQYGYIDVLNDNVTYYKYIKTFSKNTINNWFENNTTGIINSNNKSNNIYTWIDIPVNNFQNFINWKEFIRVGLDENGRFFSAGLQDKKTYSRTGKIYAFGKVPNLYGQEIRVQSFGNNYEPLLKIFTQTTDFNTRKNTYITQGQNDNGNIFIRTAESGSLGLIVSESSTVETNTIPNEVAYIKLDKNNVQLNSSKNIQLTGSIINLITNSSEENEDKIIISSKDINIINEKIKVESSEAFEMEVGSNNLIQLLKDSNNQYNFIIKIDGLERLKFGKTNFNIGINSNYCFKINSQNDSSSIIKINLMSLNFNNSDNTISLLTENSDNSKNSYININPTIVSLKSGNGSILSIDEGININNKGNFIVNSPVRFNNSFSVASNNINFQQNLYIGYNGNEYKEGCIYLYKARNSTSRLKLLAQHLEKIYKWYNNYRWGIIVSGNTVILRNVNGVSQPDGTISSGTVRWNFNKFNESAYNEN